MDTLDKASNYAHETYDKLADVAANTAETLAETRDELMDAEKKLMKNSRRYVRDNPMTAMGIAASVGFLLGSLLRTR
ncbi:DUF883 family protein [Methylomonas methanica]|jgi:ElaB/YqjD/DUF883 family membrane-anchored ribosome-binding protein|uniref:DUF883 domain-containing protein n=1 Tax=Methylomonas methanica TaxID=421 RepID=A0A177LT48_METMH|nr:DUF883 family protein [Methylomonas methanica]OAH96179.1 hypothetical protein A1332_23270 [Methylomonas methanica]OAH96978.1 hypothetical protein A1353_23620 [Methylomonas methanica]